MKTKYKIQAILIIITMAMTSVNIFAQTEKYLAAFTYQFTKYINWPSAPAVFIIGIVGNSPITQQLQQLTKEKKVGTSSIVVSEWKTSGEVGACNVLFVPESEKSNLSAIISKVGNKPVLIVTESSGTIKNGASISFTKNEGKIQFELNKTAIIKSGLTIANELERLAVKVY